jgi:hypothetical protein
MNFLIPIICIALFYCQAVNSIPQKRNHGDFVQTNNGAIQNQFNKEGISDLEREWFLNDKRQSNFGSIDNPNRGRIGKKSKQIRRCRQANCGFNQINNGNIQNQVNKEGISATERDWFLRDKRFMQSNKGKIEMHDGVDFEEPEVDSNSTGKRFDQSNIGYIKYHDFVDFEEPEVDSNSTGNGQILNSTVKENFDFVSVFGAENSTKENSTTANFDFDSEEDYDFDKVFPEDTKKRQHGDFVQTNNGAIQNQFNQDNSNISPELISAFFNDRRSISKDFKKRAFNQNYKGAIIEQNNIEQLQASNYHGQINTQLNVANEGQAKCRKRRGFNQNFHGTIGKQNNIESSKISNHFGDINSQLNVENEIDECLPEVIVERPYSRPNSRFKLTTEASFNQEFEGPIVEQNNMEEVKESNFYGDIRTQTNAQNINVPLEQKPVRRPNNQQKPYRRPNNQQKPSRRPYNQQGSYRNPNYHQKPVSNGFHQTVNGPIMYQKNYENHQTGNYYGNQNLQYNQRKQWY